MCSFYINELITACLRCSWIFFFIFNCQSQCQLLILLLTKTNASSSRYRGLLMWCLSFVRWNNSRCSSGASRCCGSPPTQTGKGRLCAMFEDFLSPPGRRDQSVRGPLRERRGQGPCQSDKTQQSPPLSPLSLSARGVCVKKWTRKNYYCKSRICASFITRWNITQWRSQERKRQNRIE